MCFGTDCELPKRATKWSSRFLPWIQGFCFTMCSSCSVQQLVLFICYLMLCYLVFGAVYLIFSAVLFDIFPAVQQSMAGFSQCSDLAVCFAGAPEHREAVGSVQWGEAWFQNHLHGLPLLQGQGLGAQGGAEVWHGSLWVPPQKWAHFLPTPPLGKAELQRGVQWGAAGLEQPLLLAGGRAHLGLAVKLGCEWKGTSHIQEVKRQLGRSGLLHEVHNCTETPFPAFSVLS